MACEAGGFFEERSETVQPANPQPQPRRPMSRRRKIIIGVAVVVGAPALIAGMVNGAKQSLAGGQATTTPASSPSASASPLPTPTRAPKTAAPVPEPTFSYPGDPQCSITYRDRGDGSTSWTATVTVAGELITHASDTSGNIYRHDLQVTPGPNAFAAPVPLAQINDIGGNLTGTDGQSYGCSVAPAR